MAALGAIGIMPQGAFKRLIPLPVTTPLGTAEGKVTRMRCILDVADAQAGTAITGRFPVAFVQDFWRITQGRSAQYLKDFKQVRGTVKNSAGTGIARRVVITNGFGQCVGRTTSSAVDGTFKLLCDNNNDSYVLCQALPDDGDLRQAVVAWKVIPVVPT